MTDIDYSRFSYKDYRRGGRRDNSRGKIRYNYANYELYRDSIPPEEEGNTLSNPVIEDVIADSEPIILGEAKKTKQEDIEDSYNIEDMRTKKKPVTGAASPITTATAKTKRRRDIIAILLVIMCFSMTILSADIITGGKIFSNLSEVFSTMSNIPVYYAVELGTYSDIDSARAASELYRKRDAGGYVINDGTYRIIAAVYRDKKDAEAIVSRLIADGHGGSIYEIKGAKVNWSKYGDIGPDLEAAILYCEKIYNSLYIISNDLDKGEITEYQTKIMIRTLLNETNDSKDTFIDKTNQYAYNDTVLLVRTELTAYAAVLENLLDDRIQRPSLLSDIRYSYTLIIHSYCRLLRTLK